MLKGFTGDDPFDLIGSGFLRAASNCDGTRIEIDADGGGDSFELLAMVNSDISNGMLADHTIIDFDPVA